MPAPSFRGTAMTNSTEAWAARRLAHLYREIGCLELPRGQRVGILKDLVAGQQAALTATMARMTAEHEAGCGRCNAGEFCLWQLTSKPEWSAISDHISRFRAAIHAEERDQAYADKAYADGVEYQHHIDGFCSYWQNLRYRRFVLVDWACEECGAKGVPLEAHHLTYDRLGFEELEDIQALCRPCHEIKR
jgi:hypothetical protein